MMSQTSTKVRVVRCPKCTLLLPELPGVPLYRCGGCGTVLQAKYRKDETKVTRPRLPETDSAQKSEMEQVSEKEEEARSISQKANVASTEETALDRSSVTEQKDFEHCNNSPNDANAQRNEMEHVSEEKEEARSINQKATVPSPEESALDQSGVTEPKEHEHRNPPPSDVLSSTGLTCEENDEPSLEPETQKEQDEKCSLYQNEPRNQNLSGRVPSSIELNSQENGESSSVGGEDIEMDESKYSLKHKNRSNQIESGDCNTELTCHENEDTSDNKGLIFSGEVSSPTKLNRKENEDSSPVAEADIEADEIMYSLKRRNGRNQMESGNCDVKWSEASSSTELTCHENEEFNRNDSQDFDGEQRGVLNFSGEISSPTELNCQESDESSPVSGTHIEVDEANNFVEQNNGRNQTEFGDFNVSNEVPFSTELNCHEIEESSPDAREDETFKSRFIFESSSEENLNERNSSDNVTPSHIGQVEQSQKTVLRGFERVSSVDTLENTVADPSPDLNVECVNVYRSATARRYYGCDGSVSSYDGLDDRVLDQHHNVSFPNNTIIRDSEINHQSRYSQSVSSEKKPYATRGSKWDRDEQVGPTRHHSQTRTMMRVETDAHQSRLPFYSRDFRAGYKNGSASGSNFQSPKKPKYLEQERVELLRMVHDLQNQLNKLQMSKEKGNERFQEKKIPSYYGNIAPEVNVYHDTNHHAQQRKTFFSGEEFTQKCFHCCPQDSHYSAQLPPHAAICNQGHQSHYLHLSGNSCPERLSSSGLSSRSCDTMSGDQWHKNNEKKSYLRERNYLKRKHFCPIAGGAPFVACYNCSKLLQMPADFLIFRRKFHRLTCSACSAVLKFSLQNRSHVVPYIPGAAAPPPSTNDNPHADPVSCSDDYDCRSLRRSCSTEADPTSVEPPFWNLQRKFGDRKMSSGSSFEPIEHRKNKSVLSVSESKHKMSNAGFSSSEIEKLPQKPGSPLHRLMGYSSPSQVLKG